MDLAVATIAAPQLMGDELGKPATPSCLATLTDHDRALADTFGDRDPALWLGCGRTAAIQERRPAWRNSSRIVRALGAVMRTRAVASRIVRAMMIAKPARAVSPVPTWLWG